MTEAKAHRLEVDGCALHFWTHGPEEAPAVVLSHGATLDHRSWAAQVPVLAGRYRVVNWDMRGHGLSRPLEGKLTFKRCAADLAAMLDHLGIERAALVGLSMGSYASQEFGYRHPARVAALASLDATSLTGTRLSAPMRWALAVSDRLLWLYPYRTLVRATARGAALTPAVQAYVAATVARLSKADYIAIWSAVQMGLRDEPGYRPPFPVLIAVGEHDRIGVTRSASIQWSKDWPEADFHLIPAAGHCANQDNPDYTNRMLADFLARHWPA